MWRYPGVAYDEYVWIFWVAGRPNPAIVMWTV